MIKSTILLAVSLLGLFAAPIAVPQNTPVRVITVPVQVITSDRLPEVSHKTAQTTAEVVISIPKAKTLHAAPAKEKVWTCGTFQESQVGGSYRTCEWR